MPSVLSRFVDDVLRAPQTAARHALGLSRLLVLAALAALALARGAHAQPPDEPVPENRDEVETLIRILEDDEARARLIERLRESAPEAPTETFSPEQTIAGRLAEYTRGIAENAADTFATLSSLVDRIADVTDGTLEVDLDALRAVALDVAAIVVAAFAVFIVAQLGFRRWQRRLADAAAVGDLVTRAKSIGGAILLDGATVVAAWFVGWLLSTQLARSGRVGFEQSLFLNAFLIVELLKTGTRAVLSPRWTALRPLPLDDTFAAYWYFWTSRLISLIGYTFLFVAPLLALGVSADVADAARIVVMLTALVISVTVVLQNRETVRARMMRRAAEGRTDPLSRLLAFIGRIWHIAAIVYLLAVFVAWLTDPDTALPFLLSATWKSVLAILLGLALATFITRVASGGMHLPDDVKERLPLLESRLNAFVPAVLRVVRLVVSIAVAVTLIEVWHIADVSAWLRSGSGQRVIASLVSAALVLLIGSVVYLAVQSWIEYRLNPNLGRFVSARERTLLNLLRNAFTVVLAVIVSMLVLAQLGVNIGPLIAGAGVVGLAVGFGAQKLVQDVINGLFIQFENTLNEGDIVQLGGISGVVERLTIRSVSLRSLDGTYHMIPFSSVDSVSNLTKHFSYHLAAISVPYRENVPEVKEAMLEAFERLKQTPHAASILGEFEMQGVVEFATSSIVVRGRIKTLPGKQWEVGRAYNEIVKHVFDERGIAIAVPHVTVYLGEDKRGHAPPLRIMTVEQRREAGSSAAQESEAAVRG